MMGVNVDSQTGSKGSIGEKYVNAVNTTLSILSERSLKPWFFSDKIFRLSNLYGKLQKCVNFMNNFANAIIREKKRGLYANKDENNEMDEDSFRKSFVDEVLRQLAITNSSWSDEDVRNEISTMIFAGSDTTAHSLSKTEFRS